LFQGQWTFKSHSTPGIPVLLICPNGAGTVQPAIHIDEGVNGSIAHGDGVRRDGAGVHTDAGVALPTSVRTGTPELGLVSCFRMEGRLGTIIPVVASDIWRCPLHADCQ
jgi:hypothetical protein